MGTVVRTALWLSLCSLTAACEASSTSALNETRTDSASVEFVTWSQSPWSDQVRQGALLLPAQAVFESIDPVLFRVADAAWRPGGVLVANVSSAQLLFFRENGSLQRVVGGPGEGPGEFTSLSATFVWDADSVAAYDPMLRRFTVFTSEGDLGRTVPIPAEGEQWVELQSAGPDLLLAIRGDQPRYRPGTHRLLVSPALLDGSGSQQSTLGSVPGATFFQTEAVAGNSPMAPGFAFAASAGVIALGDGAVPRVRLYDKRGALIRVVRWPDHDRALSPAAAEDLVARSLEAFPEEERAQMRKILDGFSLPDSVATLRDLIVSPDGDVWVGEQPFLESLHPEVPTPPQRWFVLKSTGEFVGRLSVPRGIKIVDVRRDRVLAIYVAEDGSESVRSYAFRWE